VVQRRQTGSVLEGLVRTVRSAIAVCVISLPLESTSDLLHVILVRLLLTDLRLQSLDLTLQFVGLLLRHLGLVKLLDLFLIRSDFLVLLLCHLSLLQL